MARAAEHHRSNTALGTIWRNAEWTLLVAAVGACVLTAFAPAVHPGAFALLGAACVLTLARRVLRPRHASDALFRTLFDEAAIGIYRSTADGRPIFANKAFVAMMGYQSEEQWLGAAVSIEREWYVDATRRSAFVEEIERTGAVTNFVSQIYRHASGEVIWVSETARAVRDRQGRTICYEGTIEDISDRVEAAENLKAAKEEAERASRLKTEFLANMSHELRTPLNGVLGMAELLAASEISERQRAYADVLLNSGEALLAVINDILDSSKIEAGRIELRSEPFDLREIAEDVVRLLSAKAASKGIELILSIGADAATRFIGDGQRLRQVILNLAGNAVKFTDAGYVLVGVEIQDLGAFAQIAVRVEDTGIGIAEHVQARIFEKFEQGDAPSTRAHGGTGLGLSIAREFVVIMGGDISLRSTKGQGSEFSFAVTLPRTGEKVVDPARPAIGRVLIIDDVEANRRLLSEHILAWGGEPLCAADGAEAISRARADAAEGRRFDAILIDFQMPGLNGVETAEALAAIPGLKTTPVMLLTSVDFDLPTDRLAAAGVRRTLIKPLRRDQFREALTELLADAAKAQACEAPGPPLSGTPAPCGVVSGRREPSAPQARTARILLVEDNEVNRLVARSLLAPEGYEIVEAEDGVIALELARASRFDLTLMDVSLPRLDGVAATRILRQIERAEGRKRTPIIGLSAHALDDSRDQCMAAGMDDYVTKPVKGEALKAKIAAWVGQNPAVAETGQRARA